MRITVMASKIRLDALQKGQIRATQMHENGARMVFEAEKA